MLKEKIDAVSKTLVMTVFALIASLLTLLAMKFNIIVATNERQAAIRQLNGYAV